MAKSVAIMLPIIELSTNPKVERFAWSRNNLAVFLRTQPFVKSSMLWLSLKLSYNHMSRANNQRSLNFSQQHDKLKYSTNKTILHSTT